MCRRGVIRYYPRFPLAVPEWGAGCPRVTQPFATLYTPEGALTVRLACVKRAASVHPEPGSNSPFKKLPGRACGAGFSLCSGSDPSTRSRRSRIHRINEVCTLGYTLRSVSLVCLSSISSIAVSGFQGSPRPASRSSARNHYTPPAPASGRLSDSPRPLHISGRRARAQAADG